jgi:hypothetical protein
MHTASPAGYGKIALHFDPHLGCGEAVVFPMRTDRAIIKNSVAVFHPYENNKLQASQIVVKRAA